MSKANSKKEKLESSKGPASQPSILPPPPLLTSISAQITSTFPQHVSISEELNLIYENYTNELGTHSSPAKLLLRKSSSFTSSSVDLSAETPASEEYLRFLQNCEKEGRHTLDGTILNLENNSRLKTSETEDIDIGHAASETVGSTRPAFKVDDLSTGEKTRVKFIKYGNHNAMWEVLSGQLYGLTGLAAPNTKFLIHKGFEARKNGAPQVLVASPLVTGYSDLGDFLVHPVVNKFIKNHSAKTQRDVKKWQAAILNINREAAETAITAAEKTKRLELMENIYKLLPSYFHNEIEKSFAAGKFIGNWDFSNINLNNIGCRFTLNENNEIISFESVFVDFGNSGAIGFKGLYKELSFDHANREAKNIIDSPLDYDPALGFTAKEKLFILRKAGFVLTSESNEDQQNYAWKQLRSQKGQLNNTINSIAKELADDEVLEVKKLSELQTRFRRRIMFKAAHQVLPEEVATRINPNTNALLSFSDLPRNLPFGMLLRPTLKEKTNTTSFDFNEQTYRDSEIEVAFRLSLISDAAIESVVRKWNLQKEYPNVFAIEKKAANQPEFSEEEIIEIFKERRDVLAKSIPAEVMQNWIDKNRAQALAAQNEVELAISQRTGLDLQVNPEIYHSKKPGRAQEVNDDISSFAQAIIREINHKEEEIHNSSASKKARNDIATLRKKLEQFESPDEFFINAVNEKEIELEQRQQLEILKFIERNIGKWKSALGLESKPNCSLFDLNKLREIYKSKNNILKTKEEDRMIFPDENSEKRTQLHQENIFVQNRFMKTLEKLSPSLERASPKVSNASSTQFAEEKQLQPTLI